MTTHKNKVCPQCKIRRFMVKNNNGNFVVVTVDENSNIIPLHEEESLDGYDLSILYCLGCSWKGSVNNLL